MALIKCPKCGREISDKAVKCPGCKNSLEIINETITECDNTINNSKRKEHKYKNTITISILAIILVCSIIFLLICVMKYRVKGIILENKSVSLKENEIVYLNYTINPKNAWNKKVSWESSNEKIATVENGKVIAVGSGECVVSVITSNGKKDTCKIYVKTREEIQAESVQKMIRYITDNGVISEDNNNISLIKGEKIDSEHIFYLGAISDKLYLIYSYVPKENSYELTCRYTTYVEITPYNIKKLSFRQNNSLEMPTYDFEATSIGMGEITVKDYKIGSKVNISSFDSSLEKMDGFETGLTDDFQNLTNDGVENCFIYFKKYLNENDEIGCIFEDFCFDFKE